MKRWAFNLLAGASLALAVLTAGLWVRSYWVMDLPERGFGESHLAMANAKGWVCASISARGPSVAPSPWRYRQAPPRRVRELIGQPDWKVGPLQGWGAPGHHVVAVRHWFLALLFSLAPCAWLLRGPLLGRRRVKLGLCRHCGYDLRASPGRCPECGRENAPSPLAGDSTLRGPGARSLPVSTRGLLPLGDPP